MTCEGYAMLVLTRKPNEEITIADTIKVRVLEIQGNRVRLGIEAPISVHIVRTELLGDGQEGPQERSPME